MIAGQHSGVLGAMQREHTEPLYLDVHLPAGMRFERALPEAHNAFFVVYRGGVTLPSGCSVPALRLAVLSNTPGSDGVRLQAGPDGARFLLLAGRPLQEPIAQHGPFVMNTQAELVQAVRDYQAGRF